MGLDMYLSARKHLTNYSFDNGEHEADMVNVLESIGLSMDVLSEESPSMDVEITVAYWRKANQIHRWFVDEVADGVDDCKPLYVRRDRLEELRGLLGQALAIKDGNTDDIESQLEDLLPPGDGFFFGGTEYDDWYWMQVNWTYNKLNDILDNPALDGFDFVYSASW